MPQMTENNETQRAPMKQIGIIGGTSWASTPIPYRMINEDVQARLGGHHSARILLLSIDYDPIKSLYHHGWDRIPGRVADAFREMLSHKPDCVMMANNTLHKAYDLVADEIAMPVPFFHAVDLTRDELKKENAQHVLLLGTKFTMEDGFFARKLQAVGIKVTVPTLEERLGIQAIQSRLAKGEMHPEFKTYFHDLLQRYADTGAERAILACTEIPLAVDAATAPIRTLDPLTLQCRAAVDFALA